MASFTGVDYSIPMDKDWFKRADFLQHVFNVVPSLLFIVDRDLQVIHLNKAALKLHDGHDGATLHERGGDLLHCINSRETAGGCGHSAHCKGCVLRRSVGKAFEGEDIYRETTKMNLVLDGQASDIHFMITASPIDYDGKSLVLLVMEDISELKRTEESLRQHAARLEASYKDMESFSYSASHDLRSPLIAISGFARILMEDHGGQFDEKARELLNIIGRNARKMEQLLGDLLAFSRLSTREIVLHEKKIDMEALAREAFEEVMPLLSDRKVHVEFKPLPPVAGDRTMIRQVFVNLLSNALKYTRPVEAALIEVGGAAQGHENVYYVRDNGVGFDMRYAARLFGLFSRLHGPAEFEGTGIGLVIIKRVVEKHGGRVWAEGSPNKGATFSFALPAGKAGT